MEAIPTATKAKLREAEFFLVKMHDLQNVQEEFIYCLNAFLSAARSVPDYLLEDYNVKYSLQIPLSDKLHADTFERRAKKLGNQDAISFIRWWKDKVKALMENPIFSLLTNKRHIAVHRTQIRPDLVKIDMHEHITISASIKIETYNKDGKLVQTYKSPEQPPPKPGKSEVHSDWFFSENEKEPIISVCKKYLDMMRKIVAEAELRFP